MKLNLKLLFLIVLTAFVSAFYLSIYAPLAIPTSGNKNDAGGFYKGEKGVSLTFNINWGDEVVLDILNVLERENYKNVTFFISGSWAEHHQNIVEKIVAQNYEIGLLGYNYQDYSECSAKEVFDDFKKAVIACQKISVPQISLARVPTGTFNKETLLGLNKLGLTLVHWSIDTCDWKNPEVKNIVASAKKIDDGDIVLMHASDSALQTAKALPKIIKHIHDKKFIPKNASTMLYSGKVKTKNL